MPVTQNVVFAFRVGTCGIEAVNLKETCSYQGRILGGGALGARAPRDHQRGAKKKEKGKEKKEKEREEKRGKRSE